MLTRIVKDSKAWIESTDGFRCEAFSFNGKDEGIIYSEDGRDIVFDTVDWHDSKEDREADVFKMSARQLRKYCERRLTLIYVPDVLRWRATDVAISAEDCARILANIRSACELENRNIRFVKG
jgi:hypothetical protein